ncbi:MAG: nodulation protein NfeD [Alphaproteobacteria bacterium]|nr:nodulation protein NfeD [Alphaproteobacteria bacterium]
MKKFFIAVFLLSLCLFCLPAAAEKQDAPVAYVMKVQDIITPATSDFIRRHLKYAADNKASIVVIELDTPGGLMDSMKEIVQDILASPVPVATYVSPSGAHAASAGTYILYGSHIAAMAPGTNLGAATPITMGKNSNKPDSSSKSTLETKMVNDAAAYIRSLADIRKRNGEWAEKAVRDAVSLSSNEALSQKVVDVLADNVGELLAKIDGKTVKMQDGTITLKTKGAKIEFKEPDWRTQILAIITNPNITFLLMTIGMYGLIYEFSNPGAFFPGIMGGICLLLGLFALNVLPVNYAGLLLILLGVGCMTAEAFVPSFGVLGIGGAAAFAIGGMILIDSGVPGFGVSPWLVASLTLTSLGILSVLLTMIMRARKRPVATGAEGLRGETGEIVRWSRKEGEVLAAGSVWQARSSLEYILKKGDKVKVVGIDGLCLIVQPVN